MEICALSQPPLKNEYSEIRHRAPQARSGVLGGVKIAVMPCSLLFAQAMLKALKLCALLGTTTPISQRGAASVCPRTPRGHFLGLIGPKSSRPKFPQLSGL